MATNNIEIRTIPTSVLIEARKDSKKIVGIPIVYNRWSNDLGWFRERIAPGAAFAAMAKSDPILNVNHIDEQMLAKVSSGTLRHTDKADGVHIEADPMVSRADIMEQLERGDITKMSFKFRVKKDEWVYNKEDQLDERTILELDQIYDYALVTTGEGYSDTSVALRRRDEYRKLNEQEEEGKEQENTDYEIDHEARQRKLTLLKNQMN